MRDIKQLHPDLQKKLDQLITACKKEKITIKITECLRTTKEQDNLYAQGRTKPGKVVTNCSGKSYSSMHQWGVAADFCLSMDIDGDGNISDDAFNNSKKTFNRVGAIAKSLGLIWGGDWKSIVDLPHVQLANWGDTTSKLKALYGTPDAFMKTWNKVSQSDSKSKTTTSYSKSSPEAAQSKDKKYTKTYTTTKDTNLRIGPGSKKDIIIPISKGIKVTCYGYFTKNSAGNIWLYVSYGKYTGYLHLANLK